MPVCWLSAVVDPSVGADVIQRPVLVDRFPVVLPVLKAVGDEERVDDQE